VELLYKSKSEDSRVASQVEEVEGGKFPKSKRNPKTRNPKRELKLRKERKESNNYGFCAKPLLTWKNLDSEAYLGR